MKNIRADEYEVVARKRAKLADGRFGWTGVMRAPYAIDSTVVGVGPDFISVPRAYQEGAAGGNGERAYAKLVSSDEIRSAGMRNPSKRRTRARVSAALKKYMAGLKNPSKAKGRKVKGGRAVTLKNFSGTVTRKANGQVDIRGRGRK
jgi:hypothetical protein